MKEIDGCFYDDPRIDSKYRDTISILTTADCRMSWDSFVSPSSRHYMLMGDEEWPSHITKNSSPIYNWQADWNANNFEPLRLILSDLVSDDVVISVFWSRECGLKTSWETFRDNWINFLYEDEGCIVVFHERVDAFIFTCGRVWYGKMR